MVDQNEAEGRWARHRDQRLLAILEIARTVASQQDLDVMLANFLHSLIETLGTADAGALLLHDPSEDRLRVIASHGYAPAPMRELRLAPGEALSGKAFQSGRPELYRTPEETASAMADMTPANRELFQAAVAGLGQPQSAICVPLIASQGEIGALVLENMRCPGLFALEDLAFLRQVADLIALSIENVRLREQLAAAQAISEANRLKAS